METLLYSAYDMPTFQNMTYDSPEAAKNCARGDIKLVQNTHTGLIYNAAFDATLMVYDETYQNEQSLSAGFVSHLQDVREIIDKNLGRDELIEVGCGKGFFLEMLQEKGFDVHGYDAAYEGDNPNITKAFFDENSEIRGQAIILRHVLEHIENPLKFLEQLRIDNRGGKIYIEVPCFDWICENRAWFDICYEHVNYFRLHDLEKAFGQVFDCGHFFGGQYMYIVADLGSFNSSAMVMNKQVDFPDDFLKKLPNSNGSTANFVWGASTKGVIFSVLSQRNNFHIEAAIDINPVKQGRYLPVTGIPILSPETFLNSENEDAMIFVMNSNYFDEIKDVTDNQFRYNRVDGG